MDISARKHHHKLLDNLVNRNYRSVSAILRKQPDLAREQGKYICEVLRDNAEQRGRAFEYGWQLKGEELKVLYELARVGISPDYSIKFSYVARMGPGLAFWGIINGVSYNYRTTVITIPDLPAWITAGGWVKSPKGLLSDSRGERLKEYLCCKMKFGKQLPKPKYRKRNDGKRVKQRLVTLTLDDLVAYSPIVIRG